MYGWNSDVKTHPVCQFSLCFFFKGMSESEQSLKGTSQIKILSAEDIEGMTVVCKVNYSIALSPFSVAVINMVLKQFEMERHLSFCSWPERCLTSPP